MRIIIVGGGETGRALCNILTKEGHSITLIEKDQELAKEIAEKTNALIIGADGTEVQTMEEAKISEADAVVAATNDDKSNLMVCEIAKSFNVPKIIARVNSVKNEELFTKMESMEIIPVVGLTVANIKNILESEGFRTVSVVGSGEVEIIEIKVNKDSKLIGQPVSRITKGVVSLITRRNFVTIPKPTTKLAEGDLVVVTVKVEDIPSVVKLFGSK
ncbi:hypothetical protein DRJ48_02790 [Candidatus Woesearchaeota archaeon]|nr:MAG: hypothetical protein DRJ48_02790 [Candidatus Woesearchaeota archaeon]